MFDLVRSSGRLCAGLGATVLSMLAFFSVLMATELALAHPHHGALGYPAVPAVSAVVAILALIVLGRALVRRISQSLD